MENKQKAIEEMELLLVNDILLNHNATETAEHLANKGFGNVKQAVKEFANKIERNICKKARKVEDWDDESPFIFE